MKTPVIITGVHLDAWKSNYPPHPRGRIKVSVEIEGRWIEVINETFDPSGFHISHIAEGLGIKERVK